MKGILISGVSMPDERGFVDLRIYGDGSVIMPCGEDTIECRAEEIEIEEEE